MRLVSSLALAAALAMTVQPIAAAAQEAVQLPGVDVQGRRVTPPTIEQMAAFPRMSGFSVSPDGRHIAALEGRGDEQVILVWDTANLSAAPTVIGSREMRIRAVSFVKNDVLAVSLWQPYDFRGAGITKTFINKLMLTDLEGRNWRDPMSVQRARSEAEEEAARFSSPTVLDTLPNDPDNILVTVGAEVFRLNVHNSRSERIQRSGERTIGYQTDLTGALRVRQIADRDAEGLYIATQFRDAQGTWTEHLRNHVKNREVFSIVGFTTDPNIAYAISNRGRDKAAIFEYNIATKQLGEIVFEHPLFEADGMSINRLQGPQFGEVVSFSYAGPRTTQYPIDPEFAAIRQAVEQALDVEQTPLTVVDPATGASRTIRYPVDRYVTIQSMSNDRNTAVIWAGGVNDPGAYYLLKNKTELTRLAAPYPDIQPAALGTTTLQYYKARDGLDIPVFVSRPSEALYGPGPYPTVIMPHGGPWSRDEMSWDGSMWRQLLTSRGYAVMQPQFRGSDGWGDRLWKAGDNEWGETMQNDLDDSAAWGIAEGLTAPGRVAVYGYSYGGYAAMAAAVRPDPNYKCAIAGAGVSDLSRIRSSLFQNPYTREAQRDTVSGLSPVQQAGQIKIPIMVFHGDRDQTVQLEQSEIFVNAARGSGQDVQYRVLADYAHGPAWSRDTLAEVLRIIEGYLKNDCGGSGL